MLEAAVAIAPPRAAAHHEDAYRRLLVDTVGEPLDPVIEPPPAQFEEIFCEVPIHRSGGAELDLTGMTQRAVAMRSWSEDQLHPAARGPR